jgi:glycerol-3-phosphate O-acyltransferase
MMKQLENILKAAKLGEQTEAALCSFFKSYKNVPHPPKHLDKLFQTYIQLVQKELESPTEFGHFHAKERSPFDFYAFSLDMFRPLLDFASSKVLGEENLQAIDAAIKRNENVILLANHQAEIDPQIICLLLSEKYPHLALSMAFVAGHRVTSDPFAIPFSRGTDLFPIYSKKYIEFPPEKKAEKQHHNAKTLTAIEELLKQGGLCVYVAPSGGRDRFDEKKKVSIAPFDPNSVEMFYLLAKRSPIKTHIHLLALSTIHLLPPPSTTNIELGEERIASYGPAGLFFGPELPLEDITKEERKARSDALTQEIERMYKVLW